MQLPMLKAKLHRLVVTEADLNYVGSITLDEALLEVSGIRPYELVTITNTANGAFWQTYVIAGPKGSGTVCLNGSSARHFAPGDIIIVMAYNHYDEKELQHYQPKVILVDGKNRVTDVIVDEKPFTTTDKARMPRG